MRPTRRRLIFVASPVFAVALAGCLGGYDQRGGPAIADAIRAAGPPVVAGVHYRPGDYMDSATVDILLRAGVTRAEAIEMICTVAEPAVRAGDPPDGLGVAAWDSDSAHIVASDLDPCPALS